jgi:spore coat protein CotH
MNKRNWGAVAFPFEVIALGWALIAPLTAQTPSAGAKDKVKETAEDVFGTNKVYQFHLELNAKEWETLQQVKGGRGFGFGFGAPKKDPERPAEKLTDVHKGGSFGTEFPWARGALTAEGKTYKEVGLRYKGGGSEMAAAGKLKHNFKVEFDHYDTDGRFYGLKTLNLNAGAADPTRGREALGYAVYRAAGVPAPRTAYAEVTLTLPGKYDKELLGLYTGIEQVDKTFLKDRFKNAGGLLMKPEHTNGVRWPVFDYRGDDWEQYKTPCGAKREPSKNEAQRVIEFARLIHKADDEKFRTELGSYLDVDEFLRFLACTSFVSNMDSIFTTSHNVYIYLNPETNKFVFIPWDLDLAFAGFPVMGSAEKLMDLSLTHPYPGENKLVDRLLADKEVSARYQKLLKELAATCFSKEKLLKDIDTMEKTTKEIIAREKKAAEARKERGGFNFMSMMGPTPDLRTFVENRTKSVAAQLDGKSKGYVPASLGFFLPAGKPGETKSDDKKEKKP